ncbi:MAG TPA: hypothetical protein VHC69_30450 [Polyangiaceae bacterium]|nr:hypothetical protein [Polyangiaceae bacterium]
MTRPQPSEAELVDRAFERNRFAIAQLVSLFEDRRARAVEGRARALAAADAHPLRRSATVVGITGTPGSGKSTLLSRIVPELLAADPELDVAILAVDPSSTISGGAFLGDRTRMSLSAGEPRLFFRSQASETQLGGLGPSSFRVCSLLSRLFGCVFVETVGIGQSEDDVRSVADKTLLVLQPHGGDEVQFLKAGIMETPDAFVLNKCDEPATERSYHQLRSSLWLARPFDGGEVPIYKTSARTGAGIAELGRALGAIIASGTSRDPTRKEGLFLERWIREEWGRAGSRVLATISGGAEALVRAHGGVERAQAEFERRFRSEISVAEVPLRKAGE